MAVDRSDRKVPMPADAKIRCPWTGDDPLMLRYHDEEWGVPVHEDQRWFEYLALDGFQAGLSWRTVLHKRESFRKVFHGFVPERVARMSEKEIAAACENRAIIRNRMKIRAAVENAGVFLKVQNNHGSFDAYIRGLTGGKIIHNAWKDLKDLPASTPLSDAVSKALKRDGFSFVGSTICYALLQAAGLINDHLVHCFRYKELMNS